MDTSSKVVYDSTTATLEHQNLVLARLNGRLGECPRRCAQIEANRRIIKINASKNPGIQRMLLCLTK
jgi:hypothetical protein